MKPPHTASAALQARPASVGRSTATVVTPHPLELMLEVARAAGGQVVGAAAATTF